jgi:hypothetical protein
MVLRMLSKRSMSFSQMLDELKIPSSHLTYHLENLGPFVVKMEDGKYTLSSLGKASISMMKGAEEVPSVRTNKFSSLPLRWKSLFAVLLIGIVLLASMTYIQYVSFNQLSMDYEKVKLQNQQILSWNSAERAVTIISNVIQIDLTKYHTTLLSDTVENRSDLGGVVEEILKYSLEDSESKIDLVLRFRDNNLSLYQLSSIEGLPYFGPVYIQPQPTDILQAARGVIDRYKSSTGEPYLDEMSRLLASAKESVTEQTLGNTKLKMTIYEGNAEILLLYTANGVDFSAKSLRLVFQNHVLQELSDDWSLYEVGDTQVNVSQEQAIQIARDAAKNFEWNINGVTVSNFNVLAEPVSAVFFPHPRTELLTLYPYWYVTLYLDKEYPGGVNSISVGVWADTGQVANIQALSSQATT